MKPEPVVTPAPTVVAKPAPEQAEPTPEPESEPEPSAVHRAARSRRRAEPEPEPGAHSTGGLTVAEIMANMKTAEPPRGEPVVAAATEPASDLNPSGARGATERPVKSAAADYITGPWRLSPRGGYPRC